VFSYKRKKIIEYSSNCSILDEQWRSGADPNLILISLHKSAAVTEALYLVMGCHYFC